MSKGSKSPKYISNLSKVGVPTSKSSSATESSTYDVIIVGGGTAGCVLASRLAEDPTINVLLLEAGGSGKSLLFSRIPAAFSKLFATKHVHRFWTEPQEHVDKKRKFWPRAKMLGGCSSINAEMAQYGAPGDFDEWAKITGDEAWSWKNFGRYFVKFENYTADERYPHVDMAVKGSGPVTVGYNSHFSESSNAFVEACKELKIPYSADFNTTGGTRGVNRVMTYIDEKGQRVTSETAYLTQDTLSKPNITVVIHAQVTKILFEKKGDETRAVGVEFAKSKGGPLYRAHSLKEVVVTAGAVHSPQILMLSGVGPREELEKHKIPVVTDLPGVGRNLTDHPTVDLYYKDKTNTAPKWMIPHSPMDVFHLIGAVIQYYTSKTGFMMSNWGEAAAFVRSDDPVVFPPEEYSADTLSKESASASDSPDLELFIIPLGYREHGKAGWPFHTLSLHCCLLRPLSRGTVTLKSSSPWDDPIMDPKYLESRDDLLKLTRGTRLVMKLAQTKPIASYIDQDYKGHRSDEMDTYKIKKSDEELMDLVKERLETLYHPASSCRMAPEKDLGVVDSRLRVYGIKGLRVCDASVFPSIVSGHTAAACYALGERGADIIKEDLGATHVPEKKQ
ncbi:alcohol oxidase [Dendrothele bispora CBS 962.96]|uniref:Alcohol oxidase n=1 Tax=Dendrothele bispora (strain CBS 962.96) TaxID=1314807 RepID=A0A4S8MVF3_DENBC|nr:alcohol oxidase [Dendrothele bispora CBS 962.96]